MKGLFVGCLTGMILVLNKTLLKLNGNHLCRKSANSSGELTVRGTDYCSNWDKAHPMIMLKRTHTSIVVTWDSAMYRKVLKNLDSVDVGCHRGACHLLLQGTRMNEFGKSGAWLLGMGNEGLGLRLLWEQVVYSTLKMKLIVNL
jgi:hypothetical protein